MLASNTTARPRPSRRLVAVNAQIAAIGLVQRPLRVEHGFLAGNSGDGIGVDVRRFAAFVSSTEKWRVTNGASGN